eukprot:UN2752
MQEKFEPAAENRFNDEAEDTGNQISADNDFLGISAPLDSVGNAGKDLCGQSQAKYDKDAEVGWDYTTEDSGTETDTDGTGNHSEYDGKLISRSHDAINRNISHFDNELSMNGHFEDLQEPMARCKLAAASCRATMARERAAGLLAQF